jgi:predicted DNA-binding protein (UPF0251 family)
MAGAKVTCATCAAEFKRKCNAKKGRPSVSLNKRRRCVQYILEPSKVKVKQILKTVKMGHAEKEALRREYKEQLKQFKAQAKQRGLTNTHQLAGNTQHPVTGDLSRFTSTAEKDRSGS